MFISYGSNPSKPRNLLGDVFYDEGCVRRLKHGASAGSVVFAILRLSRFTLQRQSRFLAGLIDIDSNQADTLL